MKPDDHDLDAAMRRLIDEELIASAKVAARDVRPSAPGAEERQPSTEHARRAWRRELAALAARALKMPPERLDPRENLSRYGVDSIIVTEIMKSVSERLDAPIAPTVFFEAKHAEELADLLFDRFRRGVERGPAPQEAPPEIAAPAPSRDLAQDAAPDMESEIGAWLARHRAVETPAQTASLTSRPARVVRDASAEPVAIVSMEGVFPQSADLDAFEAHLAAGDDCIGDVPPERWDWRQVYGDPREGEFTRVKSGGFAPDIDKFDPLFFGLSPREAEMMDPQHRLFMQCVWKLIEGAGYAPQSLAGRKIGLFLGVNLQDYAHLIDRSDAIEALHLTSLGHMFCPNRLSFLLDVHGPSQVIDTACSSSLVALHRAVLAVRHEGCEMAVAGGANLLITPDMHIMYSKVGIICEDGRCKTFSARANGYARADGVGAVLVKTLARAEADGDPILAVIRGSAENHGGMASSLTAPNPKAQASLIVEAHRRAGVDPRSIGYIECHGTGTALGDPIEINGLKLAFETLRREAGDDTPTAPWCGLGSVKSNIGHAETAAGIAGVIKTVLSLRRGRLYRSLHCDDVNPLIDLSGSAFYLLQQDRAFERARIDGRETPRRAAVSSFGAGGSNAHVVIEEYFAPAPPPAAASGPALIVLSARKKAQLDEIVAGLARFLVQPPEPGQRAPGLQEIAYTLQAGRDAQAERLAFVAETPAHLAETLERLARGETPAHCRTGHVARRGAAPETAPDTTARPMRAEDWDALGALFVAGAEIDWTALHDPRPRRVRLPTYPFEKRRCWLPQAGGPDRRRAGLALHPLIAENSSTLDATRFTARFTGQEFFLADHVAMGEKVLPGAAYLEMARAAVSLAQADGSGAPMRLKNVVWARPYVAGAAPRPLNVTLAAQEGRVAWRIWSEAPDGSEVLHGQGAALAGVPSPAEKIDLAALGAATPLALKGSNCYAALKSMGMAYGPAHQGLETVFFSPPGAPRQALARIVLPETLATSAGPYVLHPALIDAALQACIGLVAAALHPRPLTDGGSDRAALPFALDELILHAPPPHRLWAHVRPQGQDEARGGKLDIDLLDDAGALCVRLSGFSARRPEKTAEAALVIRRPLWRAAETQTQTQAAPAARRIVVICDPDGRFGPELEADIARVSPQARCLRPPLGASIERTYRDAVAAVFEAIRESRSHTLVQAVTPLDGDGALLAGLTGLLRAAHRENAQIDGQVVACDRAAAGPGLAQRLAQDAGHPADAEIRRRGAAREVKRWEEMPEANAPTPCPWRENGVYLIAGGGALGALFARDIARRARGATIILCGRSDIKAPTGEKIERRRADLRDAAAVERLVAGIVADHGRLDGVLHAAGVLRDNYLRNKTLAEIDAVLAPKVAGALNLDRATAALDLDLFLLFGSAAGAWGSAGQGDYAAANGFLDAFAHWRAARAQVGARRGRTLCVDWPLWAEGGMRMEANAVALMTQTTGMEPLPSAAGLAAFDRIAASGETQALPLYGAPARLARLSDQPPPTRQAAPAATSSALRSKIVEALIQSVAGVMKFDAADVEAEGEWDDYGFDSLSLTDFSNRLNQRYGLDLTPTVFFEHQTIAALADWLARDYAGALAKALGETLEEMSVEAAAAEVETARAAPPPEAATEAAPEAPASAGDAGQEPIAIVGASGAFPQAADLSQFWDNLASGRDCMSEIPADRWDWREIFGDGGARTRVKWGGFIDGVADFDAAFFGVSPREAVSMDPAQRLLMEHVWRALEDAGHAPASFAGSQTGVFIGVAPTGYGEMMAQAGAGLDAHDATGSVGSIGPNRVSYLLDLHGPSEPIETACSSALVALHRGVVAIRAGDCDAAIVGGVNLILRKETQVSFDKAGMLSPDGRCKTFASDADGYARGEGVGVLLLKRLSDAQRDGDHVYGLIRGSAVNHGGRAKSLTAPNPRAQAALIEMSWRRAGVDPATAGYIECHGTGTALGDPIEIAGLVSAFETLYRDAGHAPAAAPHCALGSVKSNIGHAELAAGVAGVLKTLLQFKHETLAPTLHCAQINPAIRLAGSPFHIVREARPWAAPTDAQGRVLPRRAGVSSFGFGGVYAHVVLEEYPAPAPTPLPEAPCLILLSARDTERLQASARALLNFLRMPGRASAPHAPKLALMAAETLAALLGVEAGDIDVAEDLETDFETLGVERAHRLMLREQLSAALDVTLDARPFLRESRLGALIAALIEAHPALAETPQTQTRTINLADLAFTLQLGRNAMDARLAFLAGSVAEVEARLAAFLDGRAAEAGICVGEARKNKALAATFTDPALQENLAGWIARGETARLADLWAKGVAIDWRGLYGPSGFYRISPRRLSLPGSPFARKRFWMATSKESATPRGSKTAQDGLRTPLRADAFYLTDHLVQGRPVLPGVVYLELARAAFARSDAREETQVATRILDVVWIAPAGLDAAQDLAVELLPAENGLRRWRITSAAGAMLHSEGAIVQSAETPPPRLDPANLLARPALREISAADCYAAFRAAGLDYGPAHRPIETLYAGDGFALARLALPESLRLDGFGLHPSLMDGALQAAVGLAAAGEEKATLALPFAIGALTLFRPLAARMWAHVRPAAGATARLRKLDIDLAGDDGEICVSIRGFATRPVAPAATRETERRETATAGTDPEAVMSHLLDWLKARMGHALGFAAEEIAADEALETYGLDSVTVMEMTAEIEKEVGPVSKTLFFEHATLAELATALLENHPRAAARFAPEAAPTTYAARAVAASAIRGRADTAAPARGALDIAIIGVSGRYPMAAGIEAFWRNLREGRDCIEEIPPERWDWRAFESAEGAAPGGHRCKWGGFVADVDKFDPLFFNIAPSAADYMDPQERLFLEHAFAALEDAGYRREDLQRAVDADDLPGQVGVYAGVMYGEYQFLAREARLAGKGLAVANFYASVANRVSYALNLHGPSLTVDTMCSSSLTAIHLACQDLTLGRTEMALAGGVNLSLHPNKYEVLSTGQYISVNGRCESFGAGGDGYVPSEGVGVLALKRLAEAERDGDHIHGVIKGSALNHGGRASGYSVPNPNAQQMAIRRALRESGVDPRAIGYIEAHGTGTRLGDPIEIAGLAKAFAPFAEPGRKWWIGSCKSNIGHCEAAAGVAGVTKALLQMREGEIAPSIHAQTLNPNIDFDSVPFEVARGLRPWPRPILDGHPAPRATAVSSFGAGGSNAHLLIEEYVAPAREGLPPQGPFVFPLSARTPEQLREQAQNLAEALTERPRDGWWLADTAFTLQTGREAMPFRLAVTAARLDELREKLSRFLAGDASSVHLGRAPARAPAARDVPALTADERAARFVAGEAPDWRPPDDAAAPLRRVSLPTYPFARERYWLETATPVPAPDVAPQAIAAPAAETLSLRPVWRAAEPRGGGLVAPVERRIVICAAPAPQIAGAQLVALASASDSLAGRYADHARQLLALLRETIAARPQGRILLQLLATPAGPCPPQIMAALSTMLTTAALEQPRLVAQTIEAPVDALLAARLDAEAADPSGRRVRYRDGLREILAFEPAPEPTAIKAAPFREGGVYLITGGAGGLGLIAAREIARRVRGARLVLTGRSSRPAAVDALAQTGATVDYRRLDVSDPQAVAELVAAIRDGYGRLDGVLHSAGVLRDGLIARKSADDLADVFAAKVAGLEALDRATAGLDLDFLALFASISGVAGNPGQADYAAANAFMDAYAHHRNAQEGRRLFLSLDWPYWAEGGMRLGDAAQNAMRTAGLAPLDTAAGIEALVAALAGDDAQRLILHGDGARLRALFAATSQAAPAAAPETQATVEAMIEPTQAAQEKARARVRRRVAALLKLPAARIDDETPLDQYGADSVLLATLAAELGQDFGDLPRTFFFEYPTVAAAGDHLAASLRPNADDPDDDTPPPPQPPARGPAAPDAHAEPPPPAAPAPVGVRDVAVIGMAGRFPGARNVEEFWELLAEGRDAIGEVPASRWDLSRHYDPQGRRPGATACKWGGFIEDVDRFDARFFRIQPGEAALLDPQERLFLETVFELLESAGALGETLARQTQGEVGVFVGSMTQQYHALRSDLAHEALVALSSQSSIANRVSHFFNFRGPSFALDAMCASSLVALHMACESLIAGDCRMAIAGGVNVTIHPKKYLALSLSQVLASRPDSRSFSEGDGYLPAEGVGAVLLKPLAAAISDGDEILGVVKSTAVNHAGGATGYRAPNVAAQAELIARNFTRAGVDPRTISYVEAAANGLPLGDAAEMRAQTEAFRRFTTESGFCALGAVKSNIGHAEAASGMSQLFKTLLQMRHGQLAPTIGTAPLNPDIRFEGTPFLMQRTLAPWRRPVLAMAGGATREWPRRAAVSSIGLGGAGAHAILEEYNAPLPAEETQGAGPWLFPISARTRPQLDETVRRLRAHLAATPGLSPEALAFTLQTAREPMAVRVGIVAAELAGLDARLAAFLRGEAAHGVFAGEEEEAAAQSHLDALARKWAGGATVVFEPLWQNRRPRRLKLPPYPFARDRYWLPEAAEPPDADEATNHADDIARFLEPLGDADQTLQALGLDSAGAAFLRREVETRFGVMLSARDLVEHPTPAALSVLIAERRPQANPARDAAPTDPAAPETHAPLTQAQLALYALDARSPGDSAYLVPMALRFAEGVEAKDFRAALTYLARRFPELGTVIETHDGAPTQRLRADPPIPFEIETIDAGDEAAALAHLRDSARRPMTLESGPLLRALFLATRSGSYGLIVVHHIVFDGASAALLLAALAETLTALAQGAPLPPPAPSPARFADAAREEAAFLASDTARRQLDFWREKLAGDPEAPRLPHDRAGAGKIIEGATLLSALPAAEAARLRAFAKAQGLNLSALFLGAFALLLHRYTGADEPLLAMPASRRDGAPFADCLGYFVNMVVICARVDGALSGAAYLKETQFALADALDNSGYPFPALLGELGMARGAASRFGVLFAYQNFAQTTGAGGDAPFVLLPQIGQEGTHELSLEVYEAAEGFRLRLGYAANLFAPATIERLARDYARLLTALAEAPDAPVASLRLTTPQERAGLLALSDGGPADIEPDKSVVDLFREQAVRRPGAVALVFERQTLTYYELNALTDRIAARLRARGVGPGDRVPVVMRRGLDMVTAFLAVLKAGAVHAPLSPDLPPRRLAALLDACGGAVALTQKALRDALPATVIPLAIEALEAEDAGAPPRETPTNPRDPAYVIFTSGSTGAPKGVVVPHGAISHHCQVKRRLYGFGEADRALLFSPMSVDAALDQLLPALTSGATVVIRPEALWSARDFRRAVAALQLTAVDLPPAYLHEALQSCAQDGGWRDLAGLRIIVSGGEALGPATVRLLRGSPLAARLFNAYGPTETTVDSVVHEIAPGTGGPCFEADADGTPIGRPLPGESAFVLDAFGALAPVGAQGELCIGGAGLALGYLDAPEQTAARFVPHPFRPGERLYRTGDLARWRADGTLSFLGRRDGQAKLNGFRFETGEVEAALRGLPGVRQAAVVTRAAGGRAVLAAFVAGAPAGNLRQALAASLPPHMIPSTVVALDALPTTPGGKIDRAALRARPVDTDAGDEAAPRGATETRLARLFAALLGRDRIGRHASFFDMGGDSLLAVRLAAAISREFGVELPLSALIAAADVARLARRLDGRAEGAAPKGRAPLFLAPPADGPLCYRALIAALDGAPVYALDAVAGDTVEEIAARQIAALRGIAPRGPYRLAGWSFGGVVAFEMARQLVAIGDRLAALVLIDSYAPQAFAALAPALGAATGDAAKVDAAMHRYAPSPLAFPDAVLLRAAESPQGDGGWSALLGGARLLVIPGDHDSALREPHVRDLAHKLETVLRDD